MADLDFCCEQCCHMLDEEDVYYTEDGEELCVECYDKKIEEQESENPMWHPDKEVFGDFKAVGSS